MRPAVATLETRPRARRHRALERGDGVLVRVLVRRSRDGCAADSKTPETAASGDSQNRDASAFERVAPFDVVWHVHCGARGANGGRRERTGCRIILELSKSNFLSSASSLLLTLVFGRIVLLTLVFGAGVGDVAEFIRASFVDAIDASLIQE